MGIECMNTYTRWEQSLAYSRIINIIIIFNVKNFHFYNFKDVIILLLSVLLLSFARYKYSWKDLD